MRYARRLIVAIFCLILAAPVVGQETKPASHEKWEKSIAGFEKMDQIAPPEKGGIVFVGSSSIVLWKIKDYFSDLPIIQRGFGGSQLADSVHFAPRIVTKYEPKTVVVYAGDNDLAGGKSPETVAADFDAFVKVVHEKLPETRIIYIAVKPSIARWKLIDKVHQTNALIAAACAKDEKRLVFLDIAPLMLGADGKPDPELFVKDGLHMSPAGYKKWSDALRPLLTEAKK
jgi:lysophospholipase L1-like esterase